MLYEIEALKMGVEVYAHHVLLKSVYRCHPHARATDAKPSSEETGDSGAIKCTFIERS
jgi:hypothetical protein